MKLEGCLYWIIPHSKIHGLTGYVCRRCNQIAFDSVRNIGYDKTMQARHMCDEEKVKSIKMVSIRPADVRNLNDTAAGIILEAKLLDAGPKISTSRGSV